MILMCSKFRQRGSWCCLIRSCNALYTAPFPYIKHPGSFSLKVLLLRDNSTVCHDLSCPVGWVTLAIKRDFVIKDKRWIIHIVWSGKTEIVAVLNTSARRKCMPFQEYNMRDGNNQRHSFYSAIVFPVHLAYSSFSCKSSSGERNNSHLFLLECLDILPRVGVRVTKITGSRSDGWIYWHFGYNFS
jgi:hypothetical protein